MAGRVSRTYKLQLSDAGLAHFIACHSRLVCIARDLIPYGMTLYVAMTVFAQLERSEQVAELEMPRCAVLAGRTVHFVGFSQALRTSITRISDGLVDAGLIADRPKVGRLYVAGLIALASAENDEIRRAYRRATELLA